MESAPHLPMLSCQLKSSPTNTDFGPALKKYIAEHYHEDPDSYTNELKDLEALRLAACNAPRTFTGCSTLKRYYSQLLCLQTRFPMTDEGPACVPFMWTDIYSGMVFNIMDIKYEEASIMYNVGALHSQLGTLQNRDNSEGMKIACTHFQCAAWALQQVRGLYPQPKGSDMSHDLLLFFSTVFLGQAQECILEKSTLDGRKSSITAKVAAQVVEYCKTALLVSGSMSSETGSIQDIVGSKLLKMWRRTLDLKVAYYTSLSCYHMGNQAEETQRMGERQAWYQLAVHRLSEAMAVAKGIEDEQLDETLAFAMDVIGGKHQAAKKENEFVYHDKVPPLDTLPEVKGANLVKGIGFCPTDPEICGADIFARLVPLEAHQASSIYSEHKARLSRTLGGRVESSNEQLDAFLASLDLDRQMLLLAPQGVPQEVMQCCAKLCVCPTATSDLVLAIQELKELFHSVDKELEQVGQLLAAEHAPASGPLAPLSAEYTKYREAHEQAADSHSSLSKSLTAHMSNLKLLSGPLEELEKALPSVALLDVPNNEAVVRELTYLMNKVEEMKQQRHMLHTRLREALQKDDVTKQIVTRNPSEELEALFERELKKHDQDVALLEQNLAAQDKVLDALTQANARFAETRRAASETLKRRQAMCASLVQSFEAYEDLATKTRKGLDLYRKLEVGIGRLLARLRSTLKPQRPLEPTEGAGRVGSATEGGSVVGPASVAKMAAYRPDIVPPSAAALKSMGVRPAPVGSEQTVPWAPAEPSVWPKQYTPSTAYNMPTYPVSTLTYSFQSSQLPGPEQQMSTYAYGQSVMSPHQNCQQPPLGPTVVPASPAPVYYGLGYGQHPGTASIQAPVSYAQSSPGQPSYQPSYQPPYQSPYQQPVYQPYQPSGDSLAGPMEAMHVTDQSWQCDQQMAWAPQAWQGNWAPPPTDLLATTPETGAQATPLQPQVGLEPKASPKPKTDPEPMAGLQPQPVLQPQVIPETKVDLKPQVVLEHPAGPPPSAAPSPASASSDTRPPERPQTKEALSLDKLAIEVERFEKCVEGLSKKSLNGPTLLEQKWKEYVDAQDRESRKLSISVARCYPMKNRIPDVMPYDHNRVMLASQRDDYINASLVKGLTTSAVSYIMTQAPLPGTCSDLWAMVWEQQTETMVCLQSPSELKSHSYWPTDKGQQLRYGGITVCLQSVQDRQFYVERMLQVVNNDVKGSRGVVHLQFADWPQSGTPTNIPHLLSFIEVVHGFHKAQRNEARPVVLHCLGGVGRSGVFCLLSAAMREVAAGGGLPDLLGTAIKLAQTRKFCLQDKEQLKLCHDALLYHAQQFLAKRGIPTGRGSFGTPGLACHPPQDFVPASAAPKKPEEDRAVCPVTSLLDPASFTLEPVAQQKRKVTREDFREASLVKPDPFSAP
uniref:Putative tyrosine-protein phosphatase non-receptor type 23 n=2 Tax=Ixodes ricinus TaxID=34613 RepID=V5H838_IXORI